MRTTLVTAVAIAASAIAAAPAGSEAPFSGAYRLLLSFGPSCKARIGSVSISLSLTESPAAAGSEIDGRPSRPDETEVGEITLLRAKGRMHGPFATQGGRIDRQPITTTEGLLILPWLVLDGTSNTGAARPQAKGTAFGFVAVGGTDEEYPSSLAFCTVADFSWSLDPQ